MNNPNFKTCMTFQDFTPGFFGRPTPRKGCQISGADRGIIEKEWEGGQMSAKTESGLPRRSIRYPAWVTSQ